MDAVAKKELNEVKNFSKGIRISVILVEIGYSQLSIAFPYLI